MGRGHTCTPTWEVPNGHLAVHTGRRTPKHDGGTLKKCVNSQAVYPLSEQDGLEAQERRYTAHEEGKH